MAVLIKIMRDGREIGRCDARCYDGIGRKCKCCCGGANHGLGLNKAIKVTNRLYDAVILMDHPKAQLTDKVLRPEVQMTLFDNV